MQWGSFATSPCNSICRAQFMHQLQRLLHTVHRWWRWCAAGPSQLQRDLYQHFLRSNAAQRLLASAEAGRGKASALTAINALRKLCGHPKLIYDVLHPATGKAPAEADGFKVIPLCFRAPFLSSTSAGVTISNCHRSDHRMQGLPKG